MQLKEVSISGLYGIHNYTIDFVLEEAIKIIHAPNGYGKTTLLRLIKNVVYGEFAEIKSIPFKVFTLKFDTELSIKVTKPENEENKTLNNLELYYEISEEEQNKQYIVTTNYDNNLDLKNALNAIRSQMSIYFINANRLWQGVESKSHRQSLLPCVRVYAKELAESMKQALAQSTRYTQKLDGSFPSRLLTFLLNPAEKGLSQKEIQEALKELEHRRDQLSKIGLFAHEEIAVNQSEIPNQGDLLKVLTLYIEDSKKKLEIFDALATKIELLIQLINKRFAYKTMRINMTEGFVFEVPTHEVLLADKLSSGEQNELILIFELLFKSESGALILIDEPEISLHIAWQQDFLEDMETIANLTGIKMIIATHSPDIINGRWDLTTALEESLCNPI